jgi:hypothetical protein
MEIKLSCSTSSVGPEKPLATASKAFGHAVVRIGPRVDTYLETQGALAQALDARTLLISVTVLRMSLPDQRLLLLHELAHLEQLAHPGDDTERVLEAEAWAAAHAWYCGAPYRIRGRGRGPLNAVAVLQPPPDGQTLPPRWYGLNPVEPIGGGASITISSAATFRHNNFDSLLDAILNAGKISELLVGCHGSDDGLNLPLRDGSTAGAEMAVITALATDHSHTEVIDGRKLNMPATSVDDLVTITGLTKAQLTDLRSKMTRLRALQLKHVAFRSCDMGKSTDSMGAFRKFFGAASVSAPSEYDAYGTFTEPKKLIQDLDAWADANRKIGYHVWIDGDVGIGIKPGRGIVYEIVAATRSKDAFKAWVKTHIMDRWTQGDIVYHGIRPENFDSPDSTGVFYVRDQGFVDRIVNFAG